MNDDARAERPMLDAGVSAVRAEIVRELGRDELARLHQQNPWLDALAVFGFLALFLVLAYALAVGSARDPLWWIFVFLQGNTMLIMAMVSHDVFTHRKWLPPRLRWTLATVLVWPAQMRASKYDEMHLTHHRELGTPGDTETYKHAINTRLRRAMFASPAMLVQHVRIMKAAPARAGDSSPAFQQRAAFESKVRWIILGLVVVAAIVDYRLLVYGYLLPFVLVLPLLNTVRIVLEHFDLDTTNPYWVGTFYRTGPVTRIMFWWIGGDCHVVHHFYAAIPWYRLPRAIRLIRPILLRNGVHEHRSLARLLRDWFIAARPHWSVPAAAAQRSRNGI